MVKVPMTISIEHDVYVWYHDNMKELNAKGIIASHICEKGLRKVKDRGVSNGKNR